MKVGGQPLPGVGFGLGVGVRLADKPDSAAGEFSWGGAADTAFWIAPQSELVVIVLQQLQPATSELQLALPQLEMRNCSLMDTVYIETTIVSYLRQRPSAQVVMAAHQVLTHQWWNNERSKYELVTSQYVIDEAPAGDPTLAAERLETLDGIPLLPPAPEIPQIAAEIISRAILPSQAQVDALHVAAVAHHRIQYLLTWNCRHIANAKILPRIHHLLNELGIPIPIICTPEELLGDDTETED